MYDILLKDVKKAHEFEELIKIFLRPSEFRLFSDDTDNVKVPEGERPDDESLVSYKAIMKDLLSCFEEAYRHHTVLGHNHRYQTCETRRRDRKIMRRQFRRGEEDTS